MKTTEQCLAELESKFRNRLNRYKLKQSRATATYRKQNYGIKARATRECLYDITFARRAAAQPNKSNMTNRNLV